MEATNGATLKNESTSTGYVVDLTPPRVLYLKDHPHNLHYQQSDTQIYAAWQFEDPESGISEYRYRVIGMTCVVCVRKPTFLVHMQVLLAHILRCAVWFVDRTQRRRFASEVANRR